MLDFATPGSDLEKGLGGHLDMNGMAMHSHQAESRGHILRITKAYILDCWKWG